MIRPFIRSSSACAYSTNVRTRAFLHIRYRALNPLERKSTLSRMRTCIPPVGPATITVNKTTTVTSSIFLTVDNRQKVNCLSKRENSKRSF